MESGFTCAEINIISIKDCDSILPYGDIITARLQRVIMFIILMKTGQTIN